MAAGEDNDSKATPPADRTGVFRLPGDEGVVVFWQGREIARYPSMEAFVTTHLDGISALEANQEELLQSAYRDTP